MDGKDYNDADYHSSDHDNHGLHYLLNMVTITNHYLLSLNNPKDNCKGEVDSEDKDGKDKGRSLGRYGNVLLLLMMM